MREQLLFSLQALNHCFIITHLLASRPSILTDADLGKQICSISPGSPQPPAVSKMPAVTRASPKKSAKFLDSAAGNVASSSRAPAPSRAQSSSAPPQPKSSEDLAPAADAKVEEQLREFVQRDIPPRHEAPELYTKKTIFKKQPDNSWKAHYETCEEAEWKQHDMKIRAWQMKEAEWEKEGRKARHHAPKWGTQPGLSEKAQMNWYLQNLADGYRTKDQLDEAKKNQQMQEKLYPGALVFSNGTDALVEKKGHPKLKEERRQYKESGRVWNEGTSNLHNWYKSIAPTENKMLAGVAPEDREKFNKEREAFNEQLRQEAASAAPQTKKKSSNGKGSNNKQVSKKRANASPTNSSPAKRQKLGENDNLVVASKEDHDVPSCEFHDAVNGVKAAPGSDGLMEREPPGFVRVPRYALYEPGHVFPPHVDPSQMVFVRDEDEDEDDGHEEADETDSSGLASHSSSSSLSSPPSSSPGSTK